MPDFGEVRERMDPVTADLLYLRFLGNRKRMDEHVEGLISRGEKQRHWDKLIWDRGVETRALGATGARDDGAGTRG